MSPITSTEHPPFGDKGFELFPQAAEWDYGSFFDSYLDLDKDALDSSDNSNESNFFDHVGLGTSSNAPASVDRAPFLASSTVSAYQANHTWHADSWRTQSTAPVPKSRKLVHKFRPEGLAISSSELLSLEGRAEPSLPATPPITPRRRSRPASPGSRLHRASKTIRSPVRIDTPRPKMMQASSYYARPDSPSIHVWTERFQRFNLQGPYVDDLPLSPPPSAKLKRYEQPEQSASLSHYAASFQPSQIQTANLGQIPDPSTPRFHPLGSEEADLSWSHPVIAADGDLSFSPFLPSQSTPYNPEFGPPQAYPPFHSALTTAGLMIDCGPFDQPAPPYPTDDLDPDARFGYDSPLPHVPTRPSTPLSSPASSPSPSSRRHRHQHQHQHRRRQHPSRRASAAAPRTPHSSGAGHAKSPSSASADVFVNYTPSDSLRLLTGVAPSGSSKTKARREREASEKRRRLSEKAVRAVRDAGGDWEVLGRELVEV